MRLIIEYKRYWNDFVKGGREKKGFHHHGNNPLIIMEETFRMLATQNKNKSKKTAVFSGLTFSPSHMKAVHKVPNNINRMYQKVGNSF